MRKRNLINRDTIYSHLLEKQFNMIDKTITDALEDRSWINTWSITSEQSKEFNKYAIGVIKKVFHCNTSKAKNTLDWFNLNHGLTIKD